MSKPTPPAYKTRNWPACNVALKRRGSLTIWFDPAMIWEAAPTGKRGRQPDYSDAAIQKSRGKKRRSKQVEVCSDFTHSGRSGARRRPAAV
jgi:hypothetical protein